MPSKYITDKFGWVHAYASIKEGIYEYDRYHERFDEYDNEDDNKDGNEDGNEDGNDEEEEGGGDFDDFSMDFTFDEGVPDQQQPPSPENMELKLNLKHPTLIDPFENQFETEAEVIAAVNDMDPEDKTVQYINGAELENTSANRFGGCQFFETADGKKVAVSQMKNYQNRGYKLRYLTLYEYVATIEILKKPSEKGEKESEEEEEEEEEELADKSKKRKSSKERSGKHDKKNKAQGSDDENDNTSGSRSSSESSKAYHTPQVITVGRKKKTLISFNQQHEISKSHCQGIRSLQITPILADGKPPAYPVDSGDSDDKILQARANSKLQFGSYVIANYSPHTTYDESSGIYISDYEYSWEGFCEYVRTLRRNPTFLNQSRLVLV